MSAALIAGAVICYVAYKLYSKWIDGRQNKHGERFAEEHQDGRADD